MATIRKHYEKWQVLIRRKFAKTIIKSFVLKEGVTVNYGCGKLRGRSLEEFKNK